MCPRNKKNLGEAGITYSLFLIKLGICEEPYSEPTGFCQMSRCPLKNKYLSSSPTEDTTNVFGITKIATFASVEPENGNN